MRHGQRSWRPAWRRRTASRGEPLSWRARSCCMASSALLICVMSECNGACMTVLHMPSAAKRPCCHGRHGARSWRTSAPTVLPACQHPHPYSLAYYNLEEFESALDAFQAAADLEPDKMIHKSWLNMCRVQLGGKRAPWRRGAGRHRLCGAMHSSRLQP